MQLNIKNMFVIKYFQTNQILPLNEPIMGWYTDKKSSPST